MATMQTIERLGFLAAELATKLRMLSLSPTASSSSSPSGDVQIEEEVEKLRRTMPRIGALLVDAEEREIRDGGIRLWLDELRDVACDAEDVVEEFEYELLRYQLVCKGEETGQDRRIERRSQVSDSHITPPCPALPDALFQEQILAKIKKINHQLDEIYKDKDALKLSKYDGQRQKQQNVMRRPPSSSVLGDSHVYGRDHDVDLVVDMLLSSHQHHEHRTKNVSVVSIVGMGGIGKTTLAQLVYNDPRVTNHFQVMSWVCVSDCFDVLLLTKETLEAVTKKKTNLKGFNQLHEKLQDSLKEKRFLLVLDDLWNENWEHWESLWKPLSSGAAGSKVLVTTRNEGVSNISGAIRTYHLGVLPKNACWSLFVQYAFGCKNPEDHPKLMSIGRQIVKKCGGIPLAVKTLGGLLSNEADEDYWNEILNSDMWELPETKNYILPALKISYHNLPLPIKPCFAVCAVFPKDYLFKREELIFVWMAQGYIIAGGRKSIEDVGQKYFDELLQRSFFQGYKPFNDYCTSYSRFKMHNLIHDLALSVLRREHSTVEAGKLLNTSGKARHMPGADITALLYGSAHQLRYLRTYYMMVTNGCAFSFKVLYDMFLNMKYLRVLHLGNVRITELPDSIGNLKHLRYLIVSGGVGFNRFPESLCDLLNLQTLQVLDSSHLKELPKNLKDLVNLRHLDLSDSWRLSMIPQGIGRLTQLKTLGRFLVGKGTFAAGIGELKHLNDLQGELIIDVQSLHNWVNREPNILNNKKGLEILHLVWNDHFDDKPTGAASITQQDQQHEELLELIQPHTSIKELHISRYIGNKLPKWMGDPHYRRLESISLCNFNKCIPLIVLGQLPLLKYLRVSFKHAVRSSDLQLFGDGMVVVGLSLFPSLEVLSFSCQEILKEFCCIGTEKGGIFPRLRALSIAFCHELKYVKLRHLSALRELSIKCCSELTTLDYCYDHPTISLLSSSGLQQEVVHKMHIPRVHTMWLEDCPKLDFLPVKPQLQVPSSLRALYLYGSPLLRIWVTRHIDNLIGIAKIFVHKYHGLIMERPHLVLHNVEDVEDAEAAKLGPKEVKGTRKLELRWDLNQHSFSRSLKSEQVLRKLNPPKDSQLEELLIEGYQGQSFPDWVGHPDYLPNLRMLTIRNCPNLRTFHLQVPMPWRIALSSNSLSMKSLPLLNLLSLENCPKLVYLVGIHGISSLRHLSLQHCPALDFSREARLPRMLEYANITGRPLLSGRFQGNRILTSMCRGSTMN